MHKIRLAWYEQSIACHVAQMRCLSSLNKGDKHRGGYDGKNLFDHNINAVASEMAVAKLLHLYWQGHANTYCSIPDIEPNIEVKNTQGKCLLIPEDRDKEDQKRSDQLIFVHTKGDIREISIIGWIEGYQAKRSEWFKSLKPGRDPIYVVPPEVLQPMEDLKIDYKRIPEIIE